jgi:lysophospholipase L1-like esterase
MLEIFYSGHHSLRLCKTIWFYCLLVFICLLPMRAYALANGDTVIFFGDSITELGVSETGYVTLIDQAIQRAYPDQFINVISSGISGNRVTDLQKRLQQDVLQLHPSLVVLNTGVNDIWLNGTTVPKQQFSQQLTSIIRQIKRTGADVILVTPAVMGERNQGENRFDKELGEYSSIMQRVGRQTRTRVVNLHSIFRAYLNRHNPQNRHMGILTVDSVHLNARGNRLMADSLLRVMRVPH